MRLVRVQVPEFRVLKDVDISFEPEYVPQVFPLGSLNGGGKSTLLQLIFVLLDIEPDLYGKTPLKNSYFKELLSDLIDKSSQKQELSKLATITLLNDEGKKIDLNYFYGDISNDGERLKEFNVSKNFIYFIYAYDAPLKGFIASANIEGEDDTPDLFKLSSKCFEIIDGIRKQITLISPSNQSYLFATQEERRLLYTSDTGKNYEILNRFKKDYPNFYTYDFIDLLTEAFQLAKEKDYNERKKTGVYGTYIEQLENAINRLFIDGKKIITLTLEQQRYTEDTIQGIAFLLPSGVEIYPEDLSHGELKRLAIFTVLTYYKIQDSIVLMDEIESGLHLDWQYTIIRDLLEWGKTNQYILATHSYELCTAVTPAHVKEIESKRIATY